MKTLLAALAIASAAVGFVACFHERDFKNGTIRCSTDDMQQCPGGSYCVDNYCIHPDLYGVDASGVDGASFIPGDGGVDAADDAL